MIQRDLTKRHALDTLETCLKEFFASDSPTCPLKTFDFGPFEERFSKEELHEIKEIRERLLCSWNLKWECDYRGIRVKCPLTKGECDFHCGT